MKTILHFISIMYLKLYIFCVYYPFVVIYCSKMMLYGSRLSIMSGTRVNSMSTVYNLQIFQVNGVFMFKGFTFEKNFSAIYQCLLIKVKI